MADDVPRGRTRGRVFRLLLGVVAVAVLAFLATRRERAHPDGGPDERIASPTNAAPVLLSPRLRSAPTDEPPATESVPLVAPVPPPTLRITVTTRGGEPVNGATVTTRWLSSAGTFEQRRDATGPDGLVAASPEPGLVSVVATHPTLGSAATLARAPGSVAVVMASGPRVWIDASRVPPEARRELRVYALSTADGATVALDDASVEEPLDAGRWPPGLLRVEFGSEPSESRGISYLLAPVDEVVVHLTLSDGERPHRVALDGTRDPWTLRFARAAPGHSGDGDVVAWRADGGASISFPVGIPRRLGRVDVDGLAPTFFHAEQLATGDDGTALVPVDLGVRVDLDADDSENLPELGVVFLGYGAPRKNVNVIAGAPARPAPVETATHWPLSPLATLLAVPAGRRGPRTVRAPAHARIGIFGDGEDRRVRQTVETGAPGTGLAVHLRTEPCATLHVRAGDSTAPGTLTLVSVPPRGGGQVLERGLVVALGPGGTARFAGLYVPFEGMLSFATGRDVSTRAVSISAPGRLDVTLDGFRRDDDAAFEVVATSEDGTPLVGAAVAWLAPNGPPSHAVTDEAGRATLRASASAVSGVSVSHDGFVPAYQRLSGSSSIRAVLRRAAALRIALADAEAGETVRYVLEREGVRIRSGRVVLTGPATIDVGSLLPGPYRVSLEQASRARSVIDVVLVAGETVSAVP